jgi:ArsR family transcriptional regulator
MSMAIDLDVELPAALKAAAEPLRWRILTALAHEELCVCHLTEDLDVAQPLISHHLRVLRDAGLVESEKWRYWTYYRLNPAAVSAVGDQLVAIAVNTPAPASERRPCC